MVSASTVLKLVKGRRMENITERLGVVEEGLNEIRYWVESLTRRLEELEYSAFQLEEDEDVVLIVVPRRTSN
jgi:hypothetical protein